MKLTLALCALALTALPAFADDVTDALTAAQSAYAAGDLSSTAAQLTQASKAVLALQAERLARFLPEAPEGWTREISDTAGAGLSMMGMAGNMVQAEYRDPQGNSYSLTLTADSPLVAQMGGVLGNPQMMAMMGKIVKVSGVDMLEQGRSLSAMIGGRVLIQAEGDDSSALQAILSKIDLASIARYDS